MQSFYLQFCIYKYAIEKWPFFGTYPVINGNPRSFYKQIVYMLAYFGVPIYISLAYKEVHLCRKYFSFLFWPGPGSILGSDEVQFESEGKHRKPEKKNNYFKWY